MCRSDQRRVPQNVLVGGPTLRVRIGKPRIGSSASHGRGGRGRSLGLDRASGLWFSAHATFADGRNVAVEFPGHDSESVILGGGLRRLSHECELIPLGDEQSARAF